MTDARAVITEAQKWLDEHPNHHSARRKDVKALIKALETALDTVAEGEDYNEQFALQVPGTVVRDEPHRTWKTYDHAKEQADLLKDLHGDAYEVVGRRKAGPWTVREA